MASSSSPTLAVEPAANGSSTNPNRVFALHTFTAENDDELSFSHGEFLTVLERDEQFGDGWWKGRNARGEEGLFPASYILPEGTDPSPYLSMQQAPEIIGGGGGAGGGLKSSAVGEAQNEMMGGARSTGERQRSPSRSRRSSMEGATAAVAPPVGTALTTEDDGDANDHDLDHVPTSTISPAAAAAAAVAHGGGSETASAAAAPSSVGGNGGGVGPIDHTVREVQQAIADHAQEGSGDSSSVAAAASASADGRDTRSRLAEQARLENERTKRTRELQQQQSEEGESGVGGVGSSQVNTNGTVATSTSTSAGGPNRISGLRLSGGVPAGLVYSDESDSGDDHLDEEDEDDDMMPSTSRLGGSGAKGVLFGVPPVASSTSESILAEKEDVSPDAASRALAAVSLDPAEKAQETMAVPVVADASAPAPSSVTMENTASSSSTPAATGGAAAGSSSSGLAAPLAATAAAAGVAGVAGVVSTHRASDSMDAISPKGSPRALPMSTAGDSTATTTATRSVHSANNADVFGTPPMTEPGQFRNSSPFEGHRPPVAATEMAPLAKTNGSSVPPSNNVSGSADIPAGDPHTWSVNEVVQWATAKGFEPAICEKFAEHEITGDVLLDLDANLLKELEIPQFGKRIKIANAIQDLRAPFTGAPMSSATRQSSFRSGMGMAAAEPIPEDAEARHTTPPVTAPSSTPQTPALGSATPVMAAVRTPSTPPAGNLAAAADQTRSSPGVGGAPEQQFAPGSGAASLAYAEWARAPKRADDEAKVHQQITPEPPLAPALESSSSTTATNAPAPLTSQHTRSASGSIKSRRSSVVTGIPPSPSTPNTKRSSQDRGHKKGKPSIDSNKGQGDRISFFGGGLGRNRKPAPRYPSSASTMNLNEDMGAPTSPTSPRAPERAISLSRFMGNGGNNKDAARLSKQSAPPTTASTGTAPSSPAPGSATTGAAASGSAIEKIGKPDFAGYMKKKGDRYNSWKNRYFVLKGANLYYLRDENEQKVKGHIDLRGYKVLSDPNTSAGNYGFQIAHEQGKTHFFSSNEHRVIKEWMKQLMKATITRDYSGEQRMMTDEASHWTDERRALQLR